MSSRLAMLPNPERKLRPIYEALETANNKKALQEAEKLLKKQANKLPPGTTEAAKVLKCLALIRLGREVEGMEQLENMKRVGILEESTLQLMSVCYRDVHKPILICEIYETANQKEPNNEEILNNLFLSYVRVGNYKKQFNSSVTLYKTKNKNLYYFWSIMSVLSQTTENIADLLHYFTISTYNYKEYSRKPPPIDNANLQLLNLAEKMVAKFVNENKLENDQEVLVYLTILEMNGKLEEAFNFINGDNVKNLEFSTIINKRIDLLIKMERWTEANDLLKSALQDEIDAWNYAMFYLDTVFQIGKQDSSNFSDESSAFSKAKLFLEELQKENFTYSSRRRGPFLAQLEFYSRLIKEGYSKEKYSNVILDGLEAYIREFGSKESCLSDVRPYLHLVDPVKLLTKVCKIVSLKSAEFPSNRNQMNLHLTNLELCRVYGITELSSEPELIQRVKTMMHYFVHCLTFNEGLLSTEPRSSDRYVILAAHTLYELWIKTSNPDYLFEAIVICHYALSHSPSNSQLKFLLLKFYHILGGCEGANNAYISLDLKHMQCDTLGYLHVFPLLANSEYNLAKTVIGNTLKFFGHNFKESADHVTFAYKSGALTKIPEFIHIREKLNYSTHYRQVTVEKMLIDIFSAQSHNSTLQAVKEILPLDKIEWGMLQDNRDLNVLWDLVPDERHVDKSVVRKTYLIDIVFLRLRSLELEILLSVAHLSISDVDSYYEPETKDNDLSNGLITNYMAAKDILYDNMLQLEENIKSLKNNSPNFDYAKYIQGPPPSRLVSFVQFNYFDPILNELKFILHLLPGNHNCKEKANSHLEMVILFFKEFVTVLTTEWSKSDGPLTRNLVIQMSTLFVEIISFTCIVIGVADFVLRKFKQILAKKNKKKKEILEMGGIQNDLDWRTDVLSKFVDSATSYFKYFETILVNKTEANNWKDKKSKMGVLCCTTDLGDKKETTLLYEKCDLANEDLNTSYCKSLDQILTVLRSKIKYVSSNRT